jgi:hypothetical protein
VCVCVCVCVYVHVCVCVFSKLSALVYLLSECEDFGEFGDRRRDDMDFFELNVISHALFQLFHIILLLWPLNEFSKLSAIVHLL